MKTIGVLLLFAALTSAVDIESLHVKWALIDPFRWSSYFEMPNNTKSAENNEMVKVRGVNSLGLSIYCIKDDPYFCTIYSNAGDVVGAQVSLNEKDLSTMPPTYDITKFEMFSQKTVFGINLWSTTVYFKDPENLKNDVTNTADSGGVWIETRNGYEVVAKNVKDLDPIWTKQACFSAMGIHYQYNMGTEMKCEDFQPYFLVFDHEGDLNAVGFQSLGKASTVNRKWWEMVPGIAVRTIVPTSPQCLVDWGSDYGIISTHIYFRNNPWNFKC